MDLNNQSKNSVNELEDQDCAVCLQKYHYPTRLPCGHIFCFLCVKGITIQSKKCAMCRKQIPSDYLDHPVVLENFPSDEMNRDCSNNEYHWYYEGRNGWWKYDDRSNIELELAFNNGETDCMLLLAGTLYCIDFRNMLQHRRSDPTRRRRVRRDLSSLPSKGIAGIKKPVHVQDQEQEVNEENVLVTSTSDQGSEVIEQSEETEQIGENTGNDGENIFLGTSYNVNSVIQSLSNMIIANPAEQNSSSNETDTLVQPE